MNESCHRCGGELPARENASPFCSHCGSPQLYLPDYEQQTGGAEAELGAAVSAAKAQRVEWKTAIRCAVLVAGIAAVLGLVTSRVEQLFFMSLLWTISGSMITLALYQRRRPTAWMDAGVGARIGVVVGLALVACLGVAIAINGLVARYGLHSMAGFDAQLTMQLQAQFDRTVAMAPQPPEVRRLWFSPEFRAGMMLFGFGMIAAILLVWSTLGGAVGGFMRTRRKASV
jgi:hypothetical protein